MAERKIINCRKCFSFEKELVYCEDCFNKVKKQVAVKELEKLLNYKYFSDEDEMLNYYIKKRLKELNKDGE